jgi:hypothetical protein
MVVSIVMLRDSTGKIICVANVKLRGRLTLQDVHKIWHWEIGSRGGIRTPDRVVNSHLLCRLSYPGVAMNAFYSKLVLFAINHLKPDSMATSALHVRWLIPNAFGTLPAELPGSSNERFLF